MMKKKMDFKTTIPQLDEFNMIHFNLAKYKKKGNLKIRKGKVYLFVNYL